MPARLNLGKQAVGVLLGALLHLFALRLQVARKTVGVPLVVWLRNVVLPVVLDEVLKVFTIRRRRIRDVVIREPSLQLSLVPFVVCCTGSVSVRLRSGGAMAMGGEECADNNVARHIRAEHVARLRFATHSAPWTRRKRRVLAYQLFLQTNHPAPGLRGQQQLPS